MIYKCCVFVVLISIAHAQVQICPDKWALNNVSVWTSRDVYSRNQYNKSANFHTLDSYAVIHVVKANVSVLCEGMVKDFRTLERLAFTDSNISKILPEAFQKLPHLTSLSLAVNRLTGIGKDDFKNLGKLTILYLSSNQIDTIEDEAFTNLPHLKKIYLDRNNIAEINDKWFRNNPRLTFINLAFNKISVLQTGAFTLPERSMIQIRLHHNLIEKVEDYPVKRQKVTREKPNLSLYLNHNRLEKISSHFIRSFDQLQSSLYLDSNKIGCVSIENLHALNATSMILHVRSNPLQCNCVIEIIDFFKNHEFLETAFDYDVPNDCYLFGVPTPREWEAQRHF